MSNNPEAEQGGGDDSWGLRARHLVIDTNIFRKLGMNLRHPLLELLKGAIDQYGITLHVNDLLLAEYRARIAVYVTDTHVATRKFSKSLKPIQFISPGVVVTPALPPAEDLTTTLYEAFRDQLRTDFAMINRPLDELDAGAVLHSYIRREPPFDKGEKEFPDAFILQMAARIADQRGGVYLISDDQALLRGAERYPRVMTLPNLASFMAIISQMQDPRASAWLQAAAMSPGFEPSLEDALREAISDAALIYTPTDVIEPEIVAADVVGIEEMTDFAPVSVVGDEISFVALVVAHLRVEVSFVYEDADHKERTVRYERATEAMFSNDHRLRVFAVYDQAREIVTRLQLLDPLIVIEESVEEHAGGGWV